MTRDEIIAKVKALELPYGSYVVYGSCPLAEAGIREANDIDIYAAPEVMDTLRERGWKEVRKGMRDIPLTHDVFDVHDNWSFSAYDPTLEHLLATAGVYDDVPFASLEEVRKWKVASGRPKDLDDITRIDAHLAARG